MRLSLAAWLLFAVIAEGADKKVVGPAKAGNDDVDITATAILNRTDAAKALGIDPGLDVILAEVHVKPKFDRKVTISRDDFTMLSRKDGQRSQAMHPSQLAGSGVMVVSSTSQGTGGGGMVGPRMGPIWGGMPGTGTRPRRAGGDNDVNSVTEASAASKMGDTQGKDNALLQALKTKELQQGEASDEVSGLLYFVFEGKHKLKDLELMYKTKGGTLMLDFEK